MDRETLPASYGRVLTGVICWTIFAFLVGAVTAPPGGGAGVLIWVFTIWYMLKRDIKTLVSLHKILMWFAFIAAGIMAALGVFHSDSITPITIEAFIATLLTGVIWGALHSYFSKILLTAETVAPVETHAPSNSTPFHIAQTKTKSTTMTELDEDAIWAAAANELEVGSINQGLWTRLLVENDGDEIKTKLAYLKARVERLIAEANSNALTIAEADAAAALEVSKAERAAEERSKIAQFQADARDLEVAELKLKTVQKLGSSLKIERYDR